MVLAVFAGCQQSGNKIISVTTAAAQKQALDSDVTVTGVLLPVNSVNVASKLPGSYQVTAINVQVGGTVKAGDTLATLDTTQLEATLTRDQGSLDDALNTLNDTTSGKSVASSSYNAAKKNYDKAKSNLDQATTDLNNLIKSGTATTDEISTAQDAVKAAQTLYGTCEAAYYQAKSGKASSNVAVDQVQASVNAYQALVNIDKLQLANATITSPIDGIVVSKNVNVGEMAAPAAPLFTIVDASTLKLKGTVSQEALPSISQGQTVDVSVDIYPGTPYTGTITLISPIAVSTGEYFPIEISMPNASGLKAGLSASASIKVTGAQNIIVPVSAVVANNGDPYVFVLQNGTAVKKSVKTGLSNTNSIEILSGLNEGDKVITSNVNILTDGMQVNEQNGDQPQK